MTLERATDLIRAINNSHNQSTVHLLQLGIRDSISVFSISRFKKFPGRIKAKLNKYRLNKYKKENSTPTNQI